MDTRISSQFIEDCIHEYYFGYARSKESPHSAVIYSTDLISGDFNFFCDLVILLEHGFDCYYVDPYYLSRSDYDKNMSKKLFETYHEPNRINKYYENVYIVYIDNSIKDVLKILYHNSNVVEVKPTDYDSSNDFQGFVSEGLNQIFLFDADNVYFNLIKIMENRVKRLAVPESIIIHYNTYVKNRIRLIKLPKI